MECGQQGVLPNKGTKCDIGLGANRFTRAVAVGNPREFTQAEKEAQEIAEACNRLIKNCIIYWRRILWPQTRKKLPRPKQHEQIRLD